MKKILSILNLLKKLKMKRVILIKPLPNGYLENEDFNKEYSVGSVFSIKKGSCTYEAFSLILKSGEVFPIYNEEDHIDETECFKEI